MYLVPFVKNVLSSIIFHCFQNLFGGRGSSGHFHLLILVSSRMPSIIFVVMRWPSPSHISAVEITCKYIRHEFICINLFSSYSSLVIISSIIDLSCVRSGTGIWWKLSNFSDIPPMNFHVCSIMLDEQRLPYFWYGSKNSGRNDPISSCWPSMQHLIECPTCVSVPPCLRSNCIRAMHNYVNRFGNANPCTARGPYR